YTTKRSVSLWLSLLFEYFFLHGTATSGLYTLSLHDALPISPSAAGRSLGGCPREPRGGSEAESRARGNNAGPLWQAPSARLLCGLSGTKHRRLQRAPHPIFSPQGVARDKDDSYVPSRHSCDISWSHFGVMRA